MKNFNQLLIEANEHRRGKREFQRGDIVSPRRGNFKGGEYVVHSDNSHENHVTIKVDGKRVQHPRSNLQTTGRRRRIPGPQPHSHQMKVEAAAAGQQIGKGSGKKEKSPNQIGGNYWR